jgi:DNA-binding response OmpR family regulator
MKKLLILDDDHDLLFILKIFLETKGYNIQTLRRADDIFSEVRDFKPDLLIIDVILQGEDGRKICQQLKAGGENKELGILLTTASLINLEDYKSWMADDYIEKPFDIYAFEEKIQSMLTWLPIRNQTNRGLL